jgi:hypothetical protein
VVDAPAHCRLVEGAIPRHLQLRSKPKLGETNKYSGLSEKMKLLVCGATRIANVYTRLVHKRIRGNDTHLLG